MFIAQAGLFLRAGIVRGGLTFTSGHGIAGLIGWAALGYALLVYPLLSIALGHGWPQTPLFGVAPCPSTIATFGLVLLAAPPLPRHLLTIPLAWAVLAPQAAVAHGVYEDPGLAIAGALTVAVVLIRGRRRNTTRRPAMAQQRP